MWVFLHVCDMEIINLLGFKIDVVLLSIVMGIGFVGLTTFIVVSFFKYITQNKFLKNGK